MMKHKRSIVLGSRFLILGSILLVVSACAPLMQNSPYTSWANHLLKEDYRAAATMTDVTAFPNWRQETEQLGRQHRGLKSLQRGDLVAPPPNSRDEVIALITITWRSGFQSCLRVQEVQNNTIKIIDTAYQNCDSISPPVLTPPPPP